MGRFRNVGKMTLSTSQRPRHGLVAMRKHYVARHASQASDLEGDATGRKVPGPAELYLGRCRETSVQDSAPWHLENCQCPLTRGLAARRLTLSRRCYSRCMAGILGDDVVLTASFVDCTCKRLEAREIAGWEPLSVLPRRSPRLAFAEPNGLIIAGFSHGRWYSLYSNETSLPSLPSVKASAGTSSPTK